MSQAGFWRKNWEDNRVVVTNSHSVVNRVWYLFPQGGGPRGSFTTFTDLKSQLRSRDMIFLSGVLKEQAVCPVGVYDVTVIGAANRPRQATNGGVPTGGGASWLAPSSPTALTPLIQVIEQGWVFQNIQFAPVAGAACIRFRRRESATIPDASHGRVEGCYFSTGGAAGIGIDGTECKRIVVNDCDFEALGAGTCITNTADGGIAAPQQWEITNNRFWRGNVNEIVAQLQSSLIMGNVFHAVYAVEAGWRVNLDGGAAKNMVIENYFSDVDTTIALGCKKAVAADIWRNYVATVADPKVVVPA